MKNLLIIIALFISIVSNAQVNRDDIDNSHEWQKGLYNYTSIEDSIKFMNLKEMLLKYEKEEYLPKEVKTDDDRKKHDSLYILLCKINDFERAKHNYKKLKIQINSFTDSEWQERNKYEQREWIYIQQIRLAGSAVKFEANKLKIKY